MSAIFDNTIDEDKDWGDISSPPKSPKREVGEIKDINFYMKLCAELTAKLEEYKLKEKTKNIINNQDNTWANVTGKITDPKEVELAVSKVNQKKHKKQREHQEFQKEQEEFSKIYFDDLISKLAELLPIKDDLPDLACKVLKDFFTTTQYGRVYINEKHKADKDYEAKKLLKSQTLENETADEFYTRKNLIVLIQLYYDLTHIKFVKERLKITMLIKSSIQSNIITNITNYNKEIIEPGFIEVEFTEKGLDMINQIKETLMALV